MKPRRYGVAFWVEDDEKKILLEIHEPIEKKKSFSVEFWLGMAFVIGISYELIDFIVSRFA